MFLEFYVDAYKTCARPVPEYVTDIFNPAIEKMVRRLERSQRYYPKIALSRCGVRSQTKPYVLS